MNLGYLTPARNCMFVVVNDTFNSNTLYIIKLLAIDKIFCYNWNIITAFRYISKQKMISLNICQYYNKLQKINNDLDFFYNSEEKWHTLVCNNFIDMSFEKTFRTAMHWTPEGKRKRGRPRTSWKGQWIASMKLCSSHCDQSRSWPRIDRGWGSFFAALHTVECNGQWSFVL